MQGRTIVSVSALIVGLFVSSMQSSARGAEITLLCAAALESWMHQVIPTFERTSGHQVQATFHIINTITERIRNGGTADLATVSPQQWEDLQKEGKLDSNVRVVIAKVGFGVFVKKGAVKPYIDSVEAFKSAFLNARSIALFNPVGGGPTAIYQARVFEQLGIAEEIKPKVRYAGRPKPNQVVSAALFELVANGDAEIGLAMNSETLQAPGVELVGSVPGEIQAFVMFTTAMPTNAKEPAAAKALIEFLTSSEATSILRSKGLEPG